MDDLIESVLQALDVESDESLAKLVQFSEVPSNSEKVQVIEELLDDWSIERPISPPPAVKSDQRSAEFLQSGDRWLRKENNVASSAHRHHFDALLNYNEAIAFAENGSSQLALGFARRTRVYFDWKLYALCLENIELARSATELDVAEDLRAELDERERLCRAALAEQADDQESAAGEQPPRTKPDDMSAATDAAEAEDERYTPQLSFPAHATVPFIADCLDIRENSQYGRYIITHRALQPGQVLAVEDRYLNVLLPKLRHQRCAHCLRENSLSLIPCAGCTSAMFCSRRCANSAQHTYHPYECPIIEYLHENCDRFHLSALRATIMAFVGLKSVERVERVVAQGDRLEPVTAFTVNHRKRAVAQRYMQVHTFPTKQQERAVPDLIATAVVVATLGRHLLMHTKFCELVSDQRGRATLQELLFRHLQISRMYFHSLSSADRQYRSDGGGLRGTGVFPFCSLINHACTPNIVRVPFGTRMVVVVLRPIGAGEQLFDNYGSHHYSESLDSRQESMLSNYLFRCQCDACHEQYDSVARLEAKQLPGVVTERDRAELAAGNRRYAADNLPRFSAYLAEHDAAYPCRELNVVQQHFRESLHIMAGNVSVRLQHGGGGGAGSGAVSSSG